MPEINDNDVVKHYINKARAGTYFGDIVMNFKAGHLTYIRRNNVITKDEAIQEITSEIIISRKK